MAKKGKINDNDFGVNPKNSQWEYLGPGKRSTSSGYMPRKRKGIWDRVGADKAAEKSVTRKMESRIDRNEG